MLDLTFGEQVKIILRRKGMTIKELAEIIEEQTGKKMSRQNLTQRLGRDNFQEQDMRQIAEILGCRFRLSIMEDSDSAEKDFNEEKQNIEIDNVNEIGTEVTVGDLIDTFVAEETVEEVYEEPVYEEPVYEEPVYEEPVYEEPVYVEETVEEVYEEPVYEEPVQEDSVEEALKELASLEEEDKAYKLEKEQKAKKKGWKDRFQFYRKKEVEEAAQEEAVIEDAVTEEPAAEEAVYEEPAVEEAVTEEPAVEEPAAEEPAYEEVYEEPVGDINPYTGREYETNSVRVHPKRIGYVQVYDGEEHQWIDMTEWAFLGYQEQKKMLLGKDYDPPIYLD